MGNEKENPVVADGAEEPVEVVVLRNPVAAEGIVNDVVPKEIPVPALGAVKVVLANEYPEAENVGNPDGVLELPNENDEPADAAAALSLLLFDALDSTFSVPTLSTDFVSLSEVVEVALGRLKEKPVLNLNSVDPDDVNEKFVLDDEPGMKLKSDWGNLTSGFSLGSSSESSPSSPPL